MEINRYNNFKIKVASIAKKILHKKPKTLEAATSNLLNFIVKENRSHSFRFKICPDKNHNFNKISDLPKPWDL